MRLHLRRTVLFAPGRASVTTILTSGVSEGTVITARASAWENVLWDETPGSNAADGCLRGSVCNRRRNATVRVRHDGPVPLKGASC